MKRRTLLGVALSLPVSQIFAQGISWDMTTDVIAVGGGAGGLTAALSCRMKKLNVVLLEKMPFLGGDSIRSGGYFNAVTEEAIRTGQDSVDLFYKQMLESSGGYADEEIVRVFVEKSGESLEWLKALGMKFLPAARFIYGGMWKRAYKSVLRSGTGYVQTLSEGCLRAGVDIRTGVKVTDIISDDTGVIGVKAEIGGKTIYIRSRYGVVLATGGFGANRDMLSRESSKSYQNLSSDSHPGATGEMIDLVRGMGARVQNMGFVECVPGGSDEVRDQVRLDYNPSLIMFVDENGRRFVNETAPRGEIYEAFKSHGVKRCYTIADSVAVGSVDLERRKNLYRGLYKGLTWRCDTLEELSRVLNVDSANLSESARTLQREGHLLKPPFWAVRVLFKIHTTLGGVAIDPGARVLKENNAPIPRLYACGQIVGNLHGKNRLGGNGLNCAVTFGRIAAESIVVDKQNS